jgi:predicted ATP-dependent protease
MKIVPVKHMDDVLDIALGKQKVIEPPKPRKRPDEQAEE